MNVFKNNFLMYCIRILTFHGHSLQNNSNVFGGGLVCTTSNLTVHESEFVSNYAGIGGGAIKLLGGILNVTSSSVSSNVAGEYGSAFDVTTQGPLSSEKTVMYVDMSDVSNNIADRGAAMFLYALDLLKVSRTTFRNNSGTQKPWSNARNPL